VTHINTQECKDHYDGKFSFYHYFVGKILQAALLVKKYFPVRWSISAMSSIRGRTGRPVGRPYQMMRLVVPGQQMARSTPMPLPLLVEKEDQGAAVFVRQLPSQVADFGVGGQDADGRGATGGHRVDHSPAKGLLPATASALCSR
jgi:hypothetical protein